MTKSNNVDILENFSLVIRSPNGFKHLRDLILTKAVNGFMSSSKPDSWTKSTLGEEVEIIRGITFPSSAKFREPGKERIVCLRTTNVQDLVDWDDLLYVPEAYVKNDNQYIKLNDILISMANSRELVGKVSLVTRDDIRCTLGGFIATSRCGQNVVPEFLMIHLRVPAIKEKLIDSSTQTTNIANISLGRLRPLEINLPSIEEQKRIVGKVSQLLDICDQLENCLIKNNSLSTSVRKSVVDAISNSQTQDEFQSAWKLIEKNWDVVSETSGGVDLLRSLILEIEMKSFLTDDSNKHEKNSNWTSLPLREVCEYIQRGKSPKYASVGSCLVVSQKCVRWSSFDPEPSRFIDDLSLDGYSPERFLQNGDLLWNSTGTGTVGRTAIFESGISEQRFVADSHVTVLRTSRINHEFLYYWSRSPDVQRTVLDSTTGSTNQQELNLGKLKELIISFPSLSEQERKVQKIKELFAICDQVETEAKKMSQKSEEYLRAVVAASA
jgi:type I restriction enzyme S subunit